MKPVVKVVKMVRERDRSIEVLPPHPELSAPGDAAIVSLYGGSIMSMVLSAAEAREVGSALLALADEKEGK